MEGERERGRERENRLLIIYILGFPKMLFAYMKSGTVCVRACMRACMHACMRACLPACVHALLDTYPWGRRNQSCTAPLSSRSRSKLWQNCRRHLSVSREVAGNFHGVFPVRSKSSLCHRNKNTVLGVRCCIFNDTTS